MHKKWNFNKVSITKVKEISEKFNISELLATVMLNRGIEDDSEIEMFLNPTRNDFHDPFLLPDMKEAVDRIEKAIDNQEKVIIYGDYDVDGITSITVLKKFLKDCGLIADYYIPNRLSEGYGLNKDAIDKIKEQGYSLIITVDCGIASIDEIDYANSLGLEVIVTDHHEPMEKLPNAVAVVDAKRKDNVYPNKNLAGVGVVFKVSQGLAQRRNIDENEILKYLDIVCVGTISDIVPLTGENRVIAKLGLKLLNVTKNPGMFSLLKASGYKEINSSTVSFGMAPRINACGRMGFEKEAVELFLTDNIVEANRITENLNKYNKERQEVEKNIYNEAIEMIENSDVKNKKSIILSNEKWHHGVIGIVSSKITDLYFKPSILLCLENGIGKGSGRSIPGIDLHEALSELSEYLDKFGGHEMAIGLTMKEENIDEFRKKFEEHVDSKEIDKIIPVLNIDKQIGLSDIKVENVKQLSLLEPFGEANKPPVFVYKNLKIDSIRALTDGKHLKLRLRDGNTFINAIGFNMGELSKDYLIGDKVDIAGNLEINSYNGGDYVQINIKDIMGSIM
ncbi:MAG: single-stranded-DNA-specific exonuclease RecJ [Clostridia bacterium]|nr:single-stranded-DNA-specific exonuclease RecJ [Clostridia bacterium]